MTGGISGASERAQQPIAGVDVKAGANLPSPQFLARCRPISYQSRRHRPGVIGQPIDGWAAVNTGAFSALVNALGGIRVDVPDALDDPDYSVDDTGRTMHVHFDRGPQAMNGERALEYARSRLSTSETDRANRQELVMSAIVERLRAVRAAPGMVPLLAAAGHGVLTSLRLPELRQLQALLDRVRPERTSRLTLDETHVLRRQPLPGGDYLLVPASGTYAELQRFVLAALP
jgi:anionic cell wall polymer biosynthesis LytR-Cps2A-Psr (LCP) family protein